MKRSARRLIGCPVSIPGRAHGSVGALHVCLTTWAVRHIELVLVGGQRLSTRSEAVLRSEDWAPNLTTTLRGTFDHSDRLSFGEPPSPVELTAEQLSTYSLATVDGASYRVTDLAIDDLTWRVDFLVVATDKESTAAIPTADVHSVERVRKHLHVVRSHAAYES